jgi:hypothetical protein
MAMRRISYPGFQRLNTQMLAVVQSNALFGEDEKVHREIRKFGELEANPNSTTTTDPTARAVHWVDIREQLDNVNNPLKTLRDQQFQMEFLFPFLR